jgi:lysyl-tRNA synthetase class I
MKIAQSNYLNMANAVITLFDGKLSAWRDIPVLVDGVERVRRIIAAIREAARKQGENKSTGHTAAKERSRDELENLTYQTAVRVRSYAGATENDVLATQMRFSRSSLDKMKTNDLLTLAQVIADACSAHLPELREYKIDETTVDSLRRCVEQTAQLYAQRDVVIDQRMEATSRLEQLFTEARTHLKTLDDLAEGYIEDDEFLAAYFNARRIHDIRGRKTKPAVNEEETV